MVEGGGLTLKIYTPGNFFCSNLSPLVLYNVEMTRCIFVFTQTIFYTMHRTFFTAGKCKMQAARYCNNYNIKNLRFILDCLIIFFIQSLIFFYWKPLWTMPVALLPPERKDLSYVAPSQTTGGALRLVMHLVSYRGRLKQNFSFSLVHWKREFNPWWVNKSCTMIPVFYSTGCEDWSA